MADDQPVSAAFAEAAPSGRELRSRKRARGGGHAPVKPPPRKRVKSAAVVVEQEPEPQIQEQLAEKVAEEPAETPDDEGEQVEETEEDRLAKLENHEIDPSTLSMYDLSHDSKHGRTSEREKKMSKIDWSAVKRKRIEEAEAIARGETIKGKVSDGVVQSTEQDEDEDGEQEQHEPVTRAMGGGVRFRVVNGEIVEEVDSLTIDRAARLVEANENSSEVVEEENDLTVRFNRTTYINARKRDETERLPMWRAKSDAWSEEETDRFYDALRMFGTDFFIISKMFAPRTRKQIKLKFIREERLEPQRINDTLLGKRTGKIDLDHFAQAIDRDVNDFHKYDSLAHANEVIRASMADKEEAMRAAVKEDEENNRQREVQRQQREKQRIEADRKKEERARKKDARRRGSVWGSGTLGGMDDDAPDAE